MESNAFSNHHNSQHQDFHPICFLNINTLLLLLQRYFLFNQILLHSCAISYYLLTNHPNSEPITIELLSYVTMFLVQRLSNVQCSENMVVNCEVDVASLWMHSVYFPGEKTVEIRSKKCGNSAETRIEDIPNTAKSAPSTIKKHSSIAQLEVVSNFETSVTVY
jgi:hypothetical protein